MALSIGSIRGGGRSGSRVFFRDVQRLVAYIYSGYGLLAPTRAAMLQREFYTMMELFDWVGIHINMGKMVSMEC